MIKKIKCVYASVRDAVTALFLKVKELVVLALNWLKWPKWFFLVTFVGMPLMAFEVLGTWFGFVWPAVGLFVWLYKKDFE